MAEGEGELTAEAAADPPPPSLPPFPPPPSHPSLSLPLSLQKLLFERGKESLESEFRSLMTRHSKVVSPVLILDLISGEDELEVQEEVPLEHLPEGVLLDIIRISRWLVDYGHNQGARAGEGRRSLAFFKLFSF